MFLCYIPDSANNLWPLSKVLLASYMQGIGSLEANEVARDIYDRLLRLEKNIEFL